MSFVPPRAPLPASLALARRASAAVPRARPRTVAMSGVAPRAAAAPDPLVQYVVVRRDLLPQWPVGSVIAQGVHAGVAAIWQSRAAPRTVQYCSPPPSRAGAPPPSAARGDMRTVVLAAAGEHALLDLAARLTDAGVAFALWREQPEDFVTALAAHPAPRSELKPHFAHLKLFK